MKRHTGSSVFGQKLEALIEVSTVVLFNILSVVFIIDSYLGSDIRHLNGWIGKDRVINRFVKLPMIVIPLFFLVAFLLKVNRKSCEETWRRYEQLTQRENAKLNVYMWSYIIGSVIFFFIGVTSPLWISYFK